MASNRLNANDPILVVDDEFLVLWMLQGELEQMGFRNIHTAAGVSSSLKLCESQKFCFAFLDVNLGSETSFSIAEALERAGVPFAFVTGYGRAGLGDAFEQTPVLSKPVDARELRGVLAVKV